MEKEFIPYEQALELKELGFDEPCFAKYFQKDGSDGFIQIGETEIEEAESAGSDITFECDAPLYQQAFRWFREKYGYYYELFVDDDKTFGFLISYFVEIGRGDKPIQRKYSTYEEAELECLNKLIEIVNG